MKKNWLNSILDQALFYHRSCEKERNDRCFPWELFSKNAKQKLKSIALKSMDFIGLRPLNTIWLTQNINHLWDARSLLEDEMSKFLFDSAIILKLVGYGKFFFPIKCFNEVVEILSEKTFENTNLPLDYLGFPLKTYSVRLTNKPTTEILKILTTRVGLEIVNNYQQYFFSRDKNCFAPELNEIVLDCGACIGDTAVLFAGLVGEKGEVHLFDPIPLHAKFCEYQTLLNPSMSERLKINALAVGSSNSAYNSVEFSSEKILPGATALDSFPRTTIDTYVSKNLKRVDYIKMDIEGSEIDAIEGAAGVISEHKPRLAISAYHKPCDFWEIPFKLKNLNPAYKIYFNHHSPVSWESMFYAI